MKEPQDILAYVLTCQEPFSQRPYGDADALAFSALAYYHFEDVACLADCAGSVRIGDLLDCASLDIYAQRMYGEKDMARLLEALVESPRFAPVMLEYAVYYVSEELTAQFSAVTLRFSGAEREELCLAFRGTDIDQVGWNEDFNLCVLPEIPSELLAATYFESVLSMHPEARVHLTGHSKGGTLAEFAHVTAREKQARQVADVVTFDAPGLQCLGSRACPELIQRDQDMALLQYERSGVVRKYLFPALLGLMLETRPYEQLLMVDTSGAGRGHDVFTPLIVEGELQTKTYPSWVLDNGLWLNRWVARLSLAERRAIIDCTFDAFGAGSQRFVFRGGKDALSVLASVTRGRLHSPRSQRRLMNRALAKLRAALF